MFWAGQSQSLERLDEIGVAPGPVQGVERQEFVRRIVGGPAQGRARRDVHLGEGRLVRPANDRAVVGVDDAVDDRLPAPDLDPLLADERLPPFAAVEVFGARIVPERDPVPVEDVVGPVGESPGDVLVVSGDDQGRGREGDAADVDAGRRELDLVPDRRERELEVHVVAEDGEAARGEPAGDGPVVAADAGTRPADPSGRKRPGPARPPDRASLRAIRPRSIRPACPRAPRPLLASGPGAA